MTLQVTPGQFVLSNGLIQLRITARGQLTGLSLRSGPNLLAGAKGGYLGINAAAAKEDEDHPETDFTELGEAGKVLRQSPELIELQFTQSPTPAIPLKTTLHYVLRRGETGFHLYTTLEHFVDQPPASVEQFGYKLRLSPGLFTYLAVDDQRRGIAHTPAQEKAGTKIMDATYRLADGRVVTKYDHTHLLADDQYHVYGWASADTGVWLIQPSGEYYPAAPFKQFLTAHQTAISPVILWETHCSHFGSPRVAVDAGEPWSKLYGPAFIYLNQNAAGPDTLWQDAKAKAQVEQRNWPRRWMQHPLYPLQRTTVTGRLMLSTGQPARHAMVILSQSDPGQSLRPQEESVATSVKGYHFWTRTDDQGKFRLEGVRLGTYAFEAAGADQFQAYRKANVRITAAGPTQDLGELTWPVVSHGPMLWQIGKADRSASEFKQGSNPRQWGLWRQFPRDFPQGVHYTLGTSTEARDWNYAHWHWHTAGTDPAWRVEFDLSGKLPAKAWLTVGILAARPAGSTHTRVHVLINGRRVDELRIPRTGAAGYRSAAQDTPYFVAEVPIEGKFLRAGHNVLSLLQHQSEPYAAGEDKGEAGIGPGYVMYDALRLEAEAETSEPSQVPK